MDLYGDVFGRSGLPEGSVLLVGSVTHLHRYGASQYAADWTKLLMQAGRDWPTVRIVPLVPMIREDVPGAVARELAELAGWFNRMYNGNIQGMGECWAKLITMVIENSSGSTPLINPDSYTLNLPSSLDDRAPLHPHTYVTRTSRPLSLKGLGKGQQSALLGAISEILGRDFLIPTGIGYLPANATETDGTKEPVRKVILVGASNLNKVAKFLTEHGYEVINLCVPGWVATPSNVTDMIARLNEVPTDSSTVLIFDVFGNSTFRYENYDGSVFMPVKSGGGYHLLGDVTVCSENIFAKQVEAVLPLLAAAEGLLRVVVPPQPRYLFSGCCKAEEHCTNLKAPNHPEKLLGATIRLREALKRKLAGRADVKLWVADSSIASTGGGGGTDRTAVNRLDGLSKVMAQDGVHYNGEGYRNCASYFHAVIQDLQCGKIGRLSSNDTLAPACVVSGSGHTHFWRGISSPVGSRMSKHFPPSQSNKFQREKQRNSTPYSRGGGYAKFQYKPVLTGIGLKIVYFKSEPN